MIALARRAFLSGGASLALAACKPEELTLAGLNPLANRNQPPRVVDRAIAAKRDFAPIAEKRRNDLAEILSSGDIPGFAAAPDLAAYCNGVLARVAEPLADLKIPLHCEILACRDPGAFAYPSGAIVLTHGLLRELPNEDALAFFLGHEIGHLALGHTDADSLANLRRYAMLGVETYAVFRMGTAGAAGRVPIEGWVAASYAANLVGRDVIAPSWSRSQEDDADKMGADLMIRAGYNAAAIGGVMDLMFRAEHAFGYKTSTELTLAEEQIARESDALRAQGRQQGPQNPFAMMIAGGIDALQSSLDSTRRNHRPPEERAALLSAYLDAEYPEAPEPPLRAAPYQAAMFAPTTAPVLARYEDAVKLMREPASLPAPQFDRRARELVQGFGARDSYIRHTVAKSLLARQARADAAMAHYKAATENERPGALAFFMLAQWHMESRRPKDALAEIDRFAAVYAESGRALTERLRIQRAANMIAESNATFARCLAERSDLITTCQRIVAETKPL